MMRVGKNWLVLAVVLASVLTAPLLAQDSTADLLKAKPLDGALILRLTDEAGSGKAAFEFKDGRAGSRFVTLANGRTFAANESVKVYLERVNPFEMSISVSESQAADANNAQLAKFVDQMLTFPGAIGLKQSGDVSPCEPLQKLYGHLEKLREALRGGTDNATQLDAWRAAVNTEPGRPGILKAQRLIAERIKTLGDNRRIAATQLTEIEKLAGIAAAGAPSQEPSLGPNVDQHLVPLEGDGDQQPAPRPAVSPTPGSGAPAVGAAPPAGGTVTPPAGASGGNPAPAAPAAQDPCADTTALAKALARVVDVGDVRLRLKNLDSLIDDVTAIANALKPFAGDKWDGTAFEVHKTEPSFDQARTVTVKVAKTTYAATADGIKVRVSDEATSTSFIIRHYQPLVPEVAAGFVISGVKIPSLGTEVKDGKLVVATPQQKEESYSAAMILNAVCRCGIDSSFVYPMGQLGVSINASAPGLLFGGGIRFVRPKRFAIAGGLVLPWAKELGDKYGIGAEVPSTSAFTDSLVYKRQKSSWYFTFQYTF